METMTPIKAMVVGAGSAGAIVVHELLTTNKITYTPVCIVDDDEIKLHNTIEGVEVVGSTREIPRIADEYGVEEILIAIPSAPKSQIHRIYEVCVSTGRKVKILPGIYQFISGEAMVEKMRPVQITDLLGREQVKVNLSEILKSIEGRVVLVTGGGGSIGSELCRQIAAHKPKQLIIFDIYENNAYDIQQELLRNVPGLNLLVLIGSVRDSRKVENVFLKYRPEIVFNAAAHKHVPLMETSPNEAVKNNVFGTLNVARCADRFGADIFVQISTDKASIPLTSWGRPSASAR